MIYTSGRHGHGRGNPLWGTQHECKGTVDDKTNGTTYVQWDNGAHNSYGRNDLEPAPPDLPDDNPNMAFKNRGRSKGTVIDDFFSQIQMKSKDEKRKEAIDALKSLQEKSEEWDVDMPEDTFDILFKSVTEEVESSDEDLPDDEPG